VNTMANAKLAVIIPMYEEEANAERCVRAVCDVLAQEVPAARLVAVNDGSKDGTLAVLKRLEAEGLPFIIANHEQNRGYGAALMTGAKEARAAGFEFGLFMDSDLTNDPALIPTFAKKLAGNQYDLIKASRYIEHGGMEGVPLYRQLVTIVGNKVASALFGMGIHDCTNGFHAVRLGLVCDEVFVERGFPMLLEELLALKKKGARATEIPYVLTSRKGGAAASKFTYSPKVVWSYLKYALLAAGVRASVPETRTN
jgi:dolichol-phosphate mannosyltransferase